MELFRKSDLKFDIEKLKSEYSQIADKYPFHNDTQLSLTSRPNSKTPLFDAVGRLFDKSGKKKIKFQHEYTVFNEEFRNTYFETVYQKVKEWSPLRIGRVRLMRVFPNQCYTIHSDHQLRYHITIETNPHSFLIARPQTENYFPETNDNTAEVQGFKVFHIPSNGYLYEFEAANPHTAYSLSELNGRWNPRVHLVFETYTDDDE